MSGPVYHALIRTHHITSRKKVATLKAAAKKYDCWALIRSGGVPGVMYVQGKTEVDVQGWIDVVHGLRYKDYQLVRPVRPVLPTGTTDQVAFGGLQEVATVKEMGALMQQHKLMTWWRAAMGFVQVP